MLLLVIHKVVGQQQTDQCYDDIICEDAIYSAKSAYLINRQNT